MKHTSKFQRWTKWFGLTLAASTLLCHAQKTSYIIDQFDTDTTAFYANQSWGTAPFGDAFNATNATPVAGYPNNSGSGSLEWGTLWQTASGDQVMVTRNFNSVTNTGDTLNFNDYTNLSFDIQFLPDCATDGNGSYGNIEIDVVPQADGWPSTYINSYTGYVTNGNGWIHVALPITVAGNSKLGAVTAYGIKLQQSKTGSSLTGTTHFLLDNVILGANTVAPPPPKLTIAPVTTPPGLLIVAKGGGNQYNRAELEANDINNGLNFSWVGATAPVTYSMTIVGYPDANHSGFESEIFLVPNGGAQDPGVDYDAANVAQMTIFNNADGSATGSFQYKTNEPQGNSGYNSYGNLGSIRVPAGALGTWSLTFNNDTNITLTGPGGITTNVNFPDEATAQVFANPLSAYFGNQQGGTTANIGQGSTYSRFSITNTPGAASFTDDFTSDGGVINLSQWIIDDPTAPGNILIVQPTDKFWVGWTLPDAGFTLQSRAAVSGGTWTNVATSALVSTTVGNQTLISTTNLPAASQGFFRMIK
ncbi:MAG TPA: hypothetical protein VHB20_03580 [Verrucomicrobiae bacterium]|jgi:hypothetical protein|nr:hypothetical protein [Verrucomicrobiae bacterium]